MTSWKAKNASREELRKRIAELEECNQRLEEDLEESMQRITTLKEQSVLQKDDLSEARIRIQSLEEELRCSAERIEQQTRDMTLLQEKIPKLESSLDYVTQQFQSEREEYRNKEKRMDRLQENVKHLEKEILRLESEKAQLLMFTASRSNSTPITPKIGGHLRSTVVAGTTQGNKERETEVIQKLKRQHQVEIVARDTHMALVVQQLEAKVARYAEALRSIGSQDALNHVDKKCEIHTHVCEEEMCTLIQERDQLLAMNDELEKRNESVWHQLQDAHETVHTLMILVSTLGCKPFDLEAVEKDDSTYEPISTTTSSVSENSFRSWLDINSNALMLDIHKLMLSQGAKSKGSLQVMV